MTVLPVTCEPDQADVDQAVARLNGAGVRLMRLDGVSMIGLWSDNDSPDLRAALKTLGLDGLPVRYLDG